VFSRALLASDLRLESLNTHMGIAHNIGIDFLYRKDCLLYRIVFHEPFRSLVSFSLALSLTKLNLS